MSVSTEERDRVEVVDLDEQAAHALFDRLTRRRMRMSAADFLRRWDAGEYEDVDWDDVPGLVAVTTALPLVRR